MIRDLLFSTHRHHRGTGVWSPATVEKATRITTGIPGNNRPAVIVFSYVTWAAYSEFPDCGETALCNLFNQLVYNPDTGKFDNELLVELKEKYYPDMSQLLINLYKKNDKPQDSAHSNAAIEWIGVVSNLNSLRGWTKDNALQIKYRRDKEEQNLASPLRNALKVVNALFGVDNVVGAMLVRQIADQINELRDLELTVDLSGVKDDGFGILALTADGKVRYELQSYKPVHFGFVQSERLNNNKSVLGAGRRDFRAFRRLMRHSNLPPRASFKDLVLEHVVRLEYSTGAGTANPGFVMTRLPKSRKVDDVSHIVKRPIPRMGLEGKTTNSLWAHSLEPTLK